EVSSQRFIGAPVEGAVSFVEFKDVDTIFVVTGGIVAEVWKIVTLCERVLAALSEHKIRHIVNAGWSMRFEYPMFEFGISLLALDRQYKDYAPVIYTRF